MAGGHSFNRRPKYHDAAESDFFERTPKHVLFRMLRAYAIFDPRFDSVEQAIEGAAWIAAAKEQLEQEY